ncbi:MAG: long-chain fatty acid--CoA ligase [Acidobacteriota bacterium]|nr:long-chain fatty acid--CoA ligase [Acidobacteriota bacterium]
MTEYITTLGRLFLNTCRTFPKPEILKSKVDGHWEAISTEEFGRRVRRLSLGLQALGLRPGDKAVLLAESGPDWIIADFAIICAGGVTVPIFPTLPADQIRYIVDNSEARFLLAAGGVLWEKVEAIRPHLTHLEKAVFMGRGEAPGGQPLAEVMALGEKAEAADPGAFERTAEAIQPDDLASLIYTSGTTGIPKGVMLTHGNFVSNIHGLDLHETFYQDDVILSFLPLSHVLERTGSFLFLFKGCTIVFAENVAAVAENMIEIRPTMMVSVPRLFEKIYARVMDQVRTGSAIKKSIFFWGVKTGKAAAALTLAGQRIPRGLSIRLGLARKLVFRKILAKTGGRFRFLVCGGAPLAADIMEFFYVVGLVIMAGYGLTETAPVLAANNPTHYRFGTVGTVLPGVTLRIAEDGEILAQGPNVMKGYFKNEAATREVMAGGWFHTGDIGVMDEEGYLTITDRKKDLIVTSGGKNVAPQPIESRILANPAFSSVVVVGAERKYIAALVVPDFGRLEELAKERGLEYKDRADLCGKPEVGAFLMEQINLATPDLADYERIKKIVVLDKDFEIGEDEVTPTLKIKRNIVEKKYKDLIDALYAE